VRRQAPKQGFSSLAVPENKALACENIGALGGTRTPSLLIRSQMLYPLSYERTNQQYTAVRVLTVRACGAYV
jgi:hypothetical protein